MDDDTLGEWQLRYTRWDDEHNYLLPPPAGIKPPAGKRNLAGVAAERFGALRQDNAGARPIGDGHQNGGGRQRPFGMKGNVAVIAGEQDRLLRHTLGQRPAQPIEKRAHGAIGKKAPALQTPGGSSFPLIARSASS